MDTPPLLKNETWFRKLEREMEAAVEKRLNRAALAKRAREKTALEKRLAEAGVPLDQKDWER